MQSSFCTKPVSWDLSSASWPTHGALEPTLGSCGDNMDVADPDGIRAMNPDIGSSSQGKRKITLKRAWGAFLPLAIDIIRGSAAQTSSADGLQSDTDFDQVQRHDEYLPSTHIGIECQQTSNMYSIQSTQATPMPPPRKRQRTDKRTKGAVPSRNMQATADEVEVIRAKLSHCRIKRGERHYDLVCPVIGCRYKQLNGRIPDFRRHVRTHIRTNSTEIRCKGVAWQDFVRYRHLFPDISDDEQPYAVPGEDGLWIGGCLKTFSRGDALKRHLRNTRCGALTHNHR